MLFRSYIVDSVISMLFTMSMYVILHKVLLILLMVIPPMLPLLIDEFISEVTTIARLMLLYLSGLHKSQNISISLTNMLLKFRNCFMILRIRRKILILLFVWPTQWPKASMFTTARSLFRTNMMLLKIPNNFSQLAQDDKVSFFWSLVIGSFGHQ